MHWLKKIDRQKSLPPTQVMEAVPLNRESLIRQQLEYCCRFVVSTDGLAVGRPSRFVGKVIESLLSGVFTIDDEELYILLHALSNSENIDLEPSALAGMLGTVKLHNTRVGQEYLSANALEERLENGTHIVWATGGSLVPREIMEDYYNKGLHLSTRKDSLTE